MPEQLNHISTEQALLKPLEQEPFYTEHQKTLIGYSIAFEGMFTVIENKGNYEPRISITNTEFTLLEKFHKIAKLGKIRNQTTRKNSKPQKIWEIANLREVLSFLKQINPHMPSPRKQRIGNLMIEYLTTRIHQCEKAEKEHKRYPDYTRRQHEIVKHIRRLNRKGRKP